MSNVSGDRVFALAERLALSLVDRGAQAVAIVGSWANGTATQSSDLDLAVIGNGPRYRLEVHYGVLVSQGWAGEDKSATDSTSLNGSAHTSLGGVTRFSYSTLTGEPRRSRRKRVRGTGRR